MEMNKELKNQLIAKYRTELYETDDVELDEIDNISNDDLREIIMINNSDIINLSNQKTLDVDLIRRLFIANVNFYKLARSRGLEIPGSSFLKSSAIKIGYDIDRLYDELSVGRSNRPSRR